MRIALWECELYTIRNTLFLPIAKKKKKQPVFLDVHLINENYYVLTFEKDLFCCITTAMKLSNKEKLIIHCCCFFVCTGEWNLLGKGSIGRADMHVIRKSEERENRHNPTPHKRGQMDFWLLDGTTIEKTIVSEAKNESNNKKKDIGTT